jgi:uncharacterized protein (DUF1800 family)
VYEPDDDRPWDLRRAGHLFRRAAFAAAWPQLQLALAEGPTRTIDRLLQPEGDVQAFNRRYDEFDASADGSETAEGLQAWWLRRMLVTPHPLQEKMTLFWHNHFAISNARVRNSTLMRQHVALLRQHALGKFPQLLQAIAHDPATLVGLDSQVNRKSAPATNFVQVLLEHYTVGPGNFEQADVKESARALTGWFVLRNQLRFIAREHDGGRKQIMGRQGEFADRDVLRIVLDQPAVARRLVRKLDRWLIAETDPPDDALLEPLAASFRRDYDVQQLVKTMLRSNRFASAASYRRRIKSPVEFAVGLARSLEALIPTAPLANDLAELGQNLLHPPTVRGWAGGSYWINPATMAGRSQLAKSLFATSGSYGDGLEPAEVARKHGQNSPEECRQFLVDLFLQGDVAPPVLAVIDRETPLSAGDSESISSSRLRELAVRLATLPDYQLS